MNQNKLRSLMFHAGFCNEDCGWDSRLIHEQEDNFKRFVELIVNECISLARNKSEFITQQASLYAEDRDEVISARATAWQFKIFEQEVKQHFGVEK